MVRIIETKMGQNKKKNCRIQVKDGGAKRISVVSDFLDSGHAFMGSDLLGS